MSFQWQRVLCFIGKLRAQRPEIYSALLSTMGLCISISLLVGPLVVFWGLFGPYLPIEIRLPNSVTYIASVVSLIGFVPYALLVGYSLIGNKRGQIKVSGSTMLKLFRFLLPKTTFERIVQDAVSDMWDQQFEAMANGEIWRARWIGVRDQLRILLALGLEPISKAILSIVAPFIPKK